MVHIKTSKQVKQIKFSNSGENFVQFNFLHVGCILSFNFGFLASCKEGLVIP